ncbi:MAG: DMT family transporter [Candidatus Dormibacteraeota bacterium]|nr:DMT family transporter [Candidatus Dormibacteraeota bacterium]
MARRNQAVYVVLLLGVTAVWGWTFVLVKDAIQAYPTIPFLGLRFLIAAAAMALVVRRLPGRRVLVIGTVIGLPLAGGYLLQTVGLRFTSPGNTGLITGLFFVFTPLLDRLFGTPIRVRTLLAVAVALAGTLLLTGGWQAGIRFGDALIVGCAVCFALQIVLLSRWSPGFAAQELTLVQLSICAVLFMLGGATQLRVPSPSVWFALVITGVFASAVAFFIQTWVQSHLTASRTALVLASEPVWALFFSVILAGQRLDAVQALGAALVIAAIVGHELPLPSRASFEPRGTNVR